ncbi:MAG: MmgE/PrpD family protein [Bacillota bacterium]
MSLIESCSSFLEKLKYEDLPSEAVKAAVRAIMDTLSVAIAGIREPLSLKLLAFLLAERSQGPATVFGTKYKFGPASAALINATAAHALDFDDVCPTIHSHPSAVVVPVILALGEEQHASGREVILAYVSGVELAAKVGVLTASSQYERGWHTTSTLGALGAAAAAAKIKRLTKSQIVNALGIAASGAGGLRKNFGTMTKPLHCGLASQNGIMAAYLAGSGFTASTDVLSGAIGYHCIFSGVSEGSIDDTGVSFGNPFEVVSPGLYLKRYPCCYATHRAADAVLLIAVNNPGLVPDEIKEITCRGPKGSFQPLIHDMPRTGLEGKFSMQYVVAAGIIDKKISLKTFTDDMVQRREIQLLMKRIIKIEDPEVNFIGPGGKDQRFTEVTVRCWDGRVFSEYVKSPKGSPENPLTDGEIIEKYYQCTEQFLSAEKRHKTAELLMNLPDVNDISELLRYFHMA